ncbi:MAG: bifunctional phosphoribosylaminoimidazolecarboxamide formyltransferase/IMP cyclohydrolase, partial [Bacteroidota bacterium]
MNIKINNALVSVFHKEGLDDILQILLHNKVNIYSTGGTADYIHSLGIPVLRVEDLTGYPSILDGRVKTLHPKVFGGILAKRENDHLNQLSQYEIPPIDLVIVDLYPFEKTVQSTADEASIIEKIDIGGISLIRAAAKNYKYVTIVSSQDQYAEMKEILTSNNCVTSIEQRKNFAKLAFDVSSHYDTAIHKYFNAEQKDGPLKLSIKTGSTLRYG